MAIRYAVVNGNWSNVATWDGGTTLPGAGDDVYADGKTVTIDQDITVLSINTTQRSGGTAGGGFTASITVTITANVVAGLSNCLTLTAIAPDTVTINGNLSVVYTTDGVCSVYRNNTATLNINGNISNGSIIDTSKTSYGLISNAAGTINVIGNIIATNAIGGIANTSNSCALYNVSTANINITGNISGANCSAGLVNYSTGEITVMGNVTGGSQNGYQNYSGSGISNQASGIVNIGSVSSSFILTGGIRGNYNGSPAIYNNTGTLNIHASIAGGTGAGISGYGIHNYNGICNLVGDQTVKGSASNIYNEIGVVNIIGDIYGSLSTDFPSNSYFIDNYGISGSVNITGNIIMQNIPKSATSGIIHNTNAGVITITGNVTGGSALNCIAISNAGTGNIIVTGNVTGGSALNSFGVYSTSNGLIDVAGNVIANASSAIYSLGLSARNLIRNYITNFNKVNAVCAVNIEVSETAGQVLVMQELVNGTDRSFSTTNVAGGLPQVTDVRYGTLYGPINEYTGTCKVPIPDKVLLGNDVDNTVGTLLMSPEDFWNFAQQYITAGIGARLKNCATVETVGEQIVSLNQQ